MAMEGSLQHHLAECSLCKGEYKQPRLLPCGHIFCEDCLHGHDKRNCQAGGKFNCPFCGQAIAIPEEGVSGFPRNLDLNHLQRITKAKIRSTALQGSATGGKENPLLENISCKKHPHLAMYCERCDESICSKCVGGHEGHRVINLNQKGPQNKTSLAETRKLLKLASLRQDKMIEAHIKERVELRNAADRATAEFNEQYDELFQKVLKTLEGRNAQIRKQCAERVALLDTKMEEGAALSARLKSCLEKHDELLKCDNTLIVIQGKRDLETVIDELTSINIDTGI